VDRTRVLFISHINLAHRDHLSDQPLIDQARERDIITIVDGRTRAGRSI